MKTTHFAPQRFKSLLASVLAVSLALNPVLLSYAETPATADPAAKPALTVSSTSLQQEAWEVDILADGVITAWQEAVVSSEIGGLRITEVLVDVGQSVKKGEPLVKLAQNTIEADIAQQMAVINQAKAEVARVQAGVLQAQSSVAQAEAAVTQAQAGLAQSNATIDQAQAGLAQANAGVAQATANLTEAQSNAERAKRLQSTGALPQQQIDQYFTAASTARAGVEGQKAGVAAQRATLEAQKAGLAARQAEVRAQQVGVESSKVAVKAQEAALAAQQAGLKVQEAGLKSHEIRLAQTTIVAADDGVISSRTASLGAVVQPGSELFRLIRKNKLEWRAEISANDLGQIREQQTANVTLPTGETVMGEVRLIAPTLDPNTRRATVYVSLPLGSSARPGMFVQGSLKQGSSNAVTLPQTAVILRDGRHYVFEILSDNHVRQHEVKVGRQRKDRVEILTDLDKNMRLVANGGAFLNDNDLVQVVDQPSTPATSTSSTKDTKEVKP